MPYCKPCLNFTIPSRKKFCEAEKKSKEWV